MLWPRRISPLWLLAAVAVLAASTPSEAQPRTGPPARPGAAPTPAGEEPEESAEAEEPATEQPTEGSEAPPGWEPPDDDAEEPLPPPVEPAPDLLGGHVTVGAGFGLAGPFGKIDAGEPAHPPLGLGTGLRLDIGRGMSRSVALGVWGEFDWLGNSGDCDACSGRSMAFGPFVRYHMVQGVRFDPWMTAGLGYRTTTVSHAGALPDEYFGFEWLHAELGADWYAFDVLGFGPYLGLGVGEYATRQSGASFANGPLHFTLTTGVRVVLDVPGK